MSEKPLSSDDSNSEQSQSSSINNTESVGDEDSTENKSEDIKYPTKSQSSDNLNKFGIFVAIIGVLFAAIAIPAGIFQKEIRCFFGFDCQPQSIVMDKQIPPETSVNKSPLNSSEDLEVKYDKDGFGKVILEIGNTHREKIVLVSNMTLHWDFQSCPKLVDPDPRGGSVPQYNYTVYVTQKQGSKLLDSRSFKYVYGEIDKFYINVEYPPGKGIYTIYLKLKYTTFGGNMPEKIYTTQKEVIRLCEKGR